MKENAMINEQNWEEIIGDCEKFIKNLNLFLKNKKEKFSSINLEIKNGKVEFSFAKIDLYNLFKLVVVKYGGYENVLWTFFL